MVGNLHKCVYGAAMAKGDNEFALVLTRPEKIAAVVMISGRFTLLVFEHNLDQKALGGMPALVTHGLYDFVLLIEEGQPWPPFSAQLFA